MTYSNNYTVNMILSPLGTILDCKETKRTSYYCFFCNSGCRGM